MPTLSSIQNVSVFDPNHAVSASPTFLVGKDREGHWLAVESHGAAGGIFASKTEAVRYAMFETDYRPDAVLLTPSTMEMKP